MAGAHRLIWSFLELLSGLLHSAHSHEVVLILVRQHYFLIHPWHCVLLLLTTSSADAIVEQWVIALDLTSYLLQWILGKVLRKGHLCDVGSRFSI